MGKFYEVKEKEVNTFKLFQIGTFEFGFRFPKKLSFKALLPIAKVVK